jgi:two-component system, chemotaxis family, chemotaxis protein CheY
MGKVLIVDDSSLMRELIKNIVVENGHSFVEASNAQEAIDRYNDSKPDMIFLDIIMDLGERTGINVLKEIMSHDPDAIVIMCTSISQEKRVIEECVESGATDYITKPFKTEEIVKALKIMEDKLSKK